MRDPDTQNAEHRTLPPTLHYELFGLPVRRFHER